jgi:hypothetical protein
MSKLFCLFMKESGSRSRSKSGTVQIRTDPGGPKTYGSYEFGSGSTTLTVGTGILTVKSDNEVPYGT